MSTIVIFIGSFNPPTLAHERLLGAAMNAISADQGLFVPLNNSLVTKKMNKTDWPDEVLSEETRVQMLAAICAADDRFAVGKPAPTHYRCPECRKVLSEVDEKHPDMDVSLVSLPVRPRQVEPWHDESVDCPYCHARVGIVLKKSAPFLPWSLQRPMPAALPAPH